MQTFKVYKSNTHLADCGEYLFYNQTRVKSTHTHDFYKGNSRREAVAHAQLCCTQACAEVFLTYFC